ncbi:hypothetical protein K8I61_15970 [bacterium]|nr:hypothetical protein [bacterium]
MPLALALFLAVVAGWMLVFVACVCFVYAAGLVVGEVAALIGVLPPTSGNILYHLVFPAQMFVMGFIALLLVAGVFQTMFGPLPARAFAALRIARIEDLAGRLALFVGIVALLELARLVLVATVVAPEDALSFFAGRGEAVLSDPTGTAVLTVAAASGAALVWLYVRAGSNPAAPPGAGDGESP